MRSPLQSIAVYNAQAAPSSLEETLSSLSQPQRAIACWYIVADAILSSKQIASQFVIQLGDQINASLYPDSEPGPEPRLAALKLLLFRDPQTKKWASSRLRAFRPIKQDTSLLNLSVMADRLDAAEILVQEGADYNKLFPDPRSLAIDPVIGKWSNGGSKEVSALKLAEGLKRPRFRAVFAPA